MARRNISRDRYCETERDTTRLRQAARAGEPVPKAIRRRIPDRYVFWGRNVIRGRSVIWIKTALNQQP
jgi:hypothetical protein